MALTVDFTAELGGVILGAGTAYEFTGTITGLGVPRPRAYDAPRGALAGEVAATDLGGKRIITLPVSIDGSSVADTMTKVATLNAAWSPAAADVNLDIRLGGVTTRFAGRPRGVDLDLGDLKSFHAEALLTFEALDPAGITV